MPAQHFSFYLLILLLTMLLLLRWQQQQQWLMQRQWTMWDEHWWPRKCHLTCLGPFICFFFFFSFYFLIPLHYVCYCYLAATQQWLGQYIPSMHQFIGYLDIWQFHCICCTQKKKVWVKKNEIGSGLNLDWTWPKPSGLGSLRFRFRVRHWWTGPRGFRFSSGKIDLDLRQSSGEW